MDNTETPHSQSRSDRTIVLVGLMGAGKSTVGHRLATRLGLPFTDADTEIEAAAGLEIPEIFERFGETYFRDGERRVIARLLKGPPHVLATGGGAFMDSETRDLLRRNAVTIWLRADLEVLAERCSRRNNRPLLADGNMKETLRKLIEVRYPVYAEADIVVDSSDEPHEAIVDAIIERLRKRPAASGAESSGADANR
ncbi:MAG: shikimate kinase [Kiloniellales bacterium]|nr:shikimate kinase [Kiloniellales bacterium]